MYQHVTTCDQRRAPECIYAGQRVVAVGQERAVALVVWSRDDNIARIKQYHGQQ